MNFTQKISPNWSWTWLGEDHIIIIAPGVPNVRNNKHFKPVLITKQVLPEKHNGQPEQETFFNPLSTRKARNQIILPPHLANWFPAAVSSWDFLGRSWVDCSPALLSDYLASLGWRVSIGLVAVVHPDLRDFVLMAKKQTIHNIKCNSWWKTYIPIQNNKRCLTGNTWN